MPVAIWLARKFDAVDKPDVRKVHSSPIFRIGGVAIFISVMCLFIPAVLSKGIFGLELQNLKADTFALLAAATFMFLVGLVDDIKNLRVNSKLAAQIIAALCVCYFGVHPHSLELPGVFTLNIGWIAWPLTIFWIVGVTNAVNIIDGLDGLVAGIALITCGVIAVLAAEPASRAILDKTRPVLRVIPVADIADGVSELPWGTVQDAWGRPLRCLTAASKSPLDREAVAVNGGRPIFISAGPDGRFGTRDIAAAADNLRSDRR